MVILIKSASSRIRRLRSDFEYGEYETAQSWRRIRNGSLPVNFRLTDRFRNPFKGILRAQGLEEPLKDNWESRYLYYFVRIKVSWVTPEVDFFFFDRFDIF